MKKCLKYLGLLITLSLILTGCGNDDAKKQLDSAIKKMESVKSLAATADIELTTEASDDTMSMIFNVDGTYYTDDKVNTSHAKIKASLLGTSNETETYTELKDGYLYNYTKDNDGWVYTKTKTPTNINNPKEQVVGIVKQFTKVRKQKSDKKGYDKLVVTIDKDKLSKVLDSGFLDSLTDSSTSDLNISEDLVIDVYLKDDYISIVVFDLSDLFSDAMDANGLTGDIKMTVTLKLDKYNQVSKITIPEEIIKTSKQQDS